MEHLNEQRLIEEMWDGVVLSPQEQDHLSLCPGCQNRRTMLTMMQRELEVARRSELSARAESELFALFAPAKKTVRQVKPLDSIRDTLMDWVHALPLWDSRQQAAAIGIRNASQQRYRLLFGADATEVELMVEPQNGFLRIVGEVMGAQSEAQSGLALVELMASPDAKSAIETESDASGRFSLEHVPPGRYMMTITPRYSHVILIESLELT